MPRLSGIAVNQGLFFQGNSNSPLLLPFLSLLQDSTARMPAIMDAMNAYAKENASQAGDGLKVLPGVTEVLKELAGRENTVVGLVSGKVVGE